MRVTRLSKDEALLSKGQEQFANDVLLGLSQSPKKISSKYFYDDEGSRLFQKITEQDDYYLTRTEHSVLKDIAPKLPLYFDGPELDIIELGVGDGHKSRVLLEAFRQHGTDVHYYPIDISSEAIELMKHNIHEQSNLKIHGVVGDYIEGLKFSRRSSQRPALVLFLGSNIGNFEAKPCIDFLRTIWGCLCEDDHLLIGFDLKKDIDSLLRAYNDSAGLTRQFNLNLLNRMNRELGAHFDMRKFTHYGVYNPVAGRMESYLVSRQEQDVRIDQLGKTFHFEAFEPIYLECSVKYSDKEILDMARESGFAQVKAYTDSRHRFMESLWRTEKSACKVRADIPQERRYYQSPQQLQ